MERARILLQYHTGKNLSAIHRALNISRVTTYHCVHKALDMGVEAGLRDAFHRPRAPVIGSADKSWVVHLACTKPKELGYAAELWTRKALSVHVRQHAQAAGHPSLVRAAKATVQRILDEPQLQPHKVRYYTWNGAIRNITHEFEDRRQRNVQVPYNRLHVRRNHKL